MTNAGIKAVLKKVKLENEVLSTSWMEFYLNVYLYLALITNALMIPRAPFGLYNIPIWIGEGSILELIQFFVSVIAAIAAMMTFIELRDFTPTGYKWNIVLLCAGYAENSLSLFSRWLQEYAAGGLKLEFLIGAQVAGIFIWLVPNLIYFRKRRRLFRIYTTAEVVAALKGEPPVAVVAVAAVPARKLCRYQPSKAGVDTRKFWLAKVGKATRYTRIIKAHKQMRVR